MNDIHISDYALIRHGSVLIVSIIFTSTIKHTLKVWNKTLMQLQENNQSMTRWWTTASKNAPTLR